MRQPEHLGLADALREFQALLTSVALGHAPDREAAMAYSRLRAQLLNTGTDALIPGFVYQCASIASFRTFIGLYHPLKTARQEFIENCFARANRAYDRRPIKLARKFGEF